MRKIIFAGMLSLLVLLMAMPFAAAETQKATGTANGFGGELTVEVTVDGKQIVSVEVLENKETPGVADPAINNLPGEIVAAQSVAVDVKSGCTLASNAVLEATKAALLSLGFTEEEITSRWRPRPPLRRRS
ncbi:MAG: FMN-binding protein [Candidatus Ventricola sp.]